MCHSGYSVSNSFLIFRQVSLDLRQKSKSKNDFKMDLRHNTPSILLRLLMKQISFEICMSRPPQLNKTWQTSIKVKKWSKTCRAGLNLAHEADIWGQQITFLWKIFRCWDTPQFSMTLSARSCNIYLVLFEKIVGKYCIRAVKRKPAVSFNFRYSVSRCC